MLSGDNVVQQQIAHAYTSRKSKDHVSLGWRQGTNALKSQWLAPWSALWAWAAQGPAQCPRHHDNLRE